MLQSCRPTADPCPVLTQACTGPPDPRADGPRDAGLTLVEVMVALVLFAVGSLALLSVLMSSMSSTFDNRARVTAANLAAADIDEARSLDYYALGSVVPHDKVVDGRTYTVVRDVVATMASGATTSSCVGSGSAKQLHKRVSTRVETAFRSPSTKPARADTLVKAPLFDPNSPTGAIALTVIDRRGIGLPGLAASVSGVSRTTDANGCAFFDGLAAGDHVVTVVRSGSVTRQGSSTLSRTVNVTAGQVSPSVLRVDTAVPVKAMADIYEEATAVANYLLPANLAARISAPERTIPTRIDYPALTLTKGLDVSWNAFPDPGGYDAYTGPCSPVVHVDSEPGTTPRAVIALSPVRITLDVVGSQDIKARDARVKATWEPPLGCASPEELTTADKTDSMCSPKAGTCVLRMGLPPGKWRLTVPGATGSADITVEPRKRLAVTIVLS